MRKRNVLILPTFTVLFMTLLFIGCEYEESNSVNNHVFYETASKSNYDLTNQIELNRLTKILSREQGEIKIIKDATVVSLTDSQGDFKALSVTYQVKNLITQMIIPITEVSKEKIGVETAKANEKVSSYYVAEPCEMKCTTAWPCSSCTQEIIERCKSQKCTCNSGSEGCSASIVFPPE